MSYFFQRFMPTIHFDKPGDGGAGDGGDGDGDGGGSAESGKVDTSRTGENLESIEDYKKVLKKTREEAKSHREKNEDLENRLNTLEKGLKAALGEEDGDPDPEKLQQKVSSMESELTRARTKNAVIAQSFRLGLDPDLTVAYLQTNGKLDDLDPQDTDKVRSVLEGAAKEKPNLKMGKPDKVGSDDEEEQPKEKQTLNPIDQYRKQRGILEKTEK